LIPKISYHAVEGIDFPGIAIIRGSEIAHRRFNSGDGNFQFPRSIWINYSRHLFQSIELCTPAVARLEANVGPQLTELLFRHFLQTVTESNTADAPLRKGLALEPNAERLTTPHSPPRF
jgi:hypothetical protein